MPNPHGTVPPNTPIHETEPPSPHLDGTATPPADPDLPTIPYESPEELAARAVDLYPQQDEPWAPQEPTNTDLILQRYPYCPRCNIAGPLNIVPPIPPFQFPWALASRETTFTTPQSYVDDVFQITHHTSKDTILRAGLQATTGLYDALTAEGFVMSGEKRCECIPPMHRHPISKTLKGQRNHRIRTLRSATLRSR